MAESCLPQICMEPLVSKPAETPIEQLRALVSLVEAARLQSRPLTVEEDARIEAARDSKAPLVAIAAMQAGDADRTELCSLGHRLWAALGFAASEKKQDARCRSLACELYAAGSKGSSESVGQEMLAIHWALAGRAWVLASDDQKALLCFAEALQPFRAQPQRCHAKLAELAAQTYLWMADVHFRQATYKEAFADLAGVRELLALRPEIRPAQLDGLLFHCHKQAVSHHSAGNLSEAVELLNLAVAAVPAGGAVVAHPRNAGCSACWLSATWTCPIWTLLWPIPSRRSQKPRIRKSGGWHCRSSLRLWFSADRKVLKCQPDQ
ncbi:unnamed protein product [Symbiodinium sp. CCMP2592]|nr:unnamed protein product [Symbiodinium sp. CCMP2592]